MSEAKFTPGPWTHNPQFPTSVWAGDVWIGSANVETVPSMDERTANARMFAAALEMYAALIELRAWCGPGTAHSRGAKCETWSEADELVTAALAKARGEAQ